MKKQYALFLAGVLLLLPGAASAMDSATLLSNPARYRVVHADDEEVVYADMDSLAGMQTRDYPSSIENMTVTLYAERYGRKPTAMDFEQGKLVSAIQEYKADLHANKRSGKYALKTELTAVYDRDGKALSLSGKQEKTEAEGKEVYFNLYRLRQAGAR